MAKSECRDVSVSEHDVAAEGGPSLGGIIRKPTLAEVQGIKRLIDDTVVQDGAMLSRTLIELCENIRDFQVYVDEHGVGGCCALHVEMADLAEIRSLAVRKELRARGLGVRVGDFGIRVSHGEDDRILRH